MAVITYKLSGNFERARPSVVCAIHNALKYPDDALLFLSDLRAIANGDHECWDGNEIEDSDGHPYLSVQRHVGDIHGWDTQ